MNNRGSVSDATRRKVLAAAQKLAYKPNALARSLVTGTSRSVGLIVPDISDPYFMEIAKGVEDCASAHDYSVVLCNTDRNPDKERQYFDVLKEKRVDGIIFTGGGINNDRHLLLLEDEAIGVVVIGRHAVPFKSISVDNVAAAYDLTLHLLNKGHRRIAFLSGPLSSTTSQDRLEGYKRALARFGAQCDEALVREEDFKAQSGRNAAMALLDLEGPARPTALIAANDQMAIGAISGARERGLRVPEDLAVAGFDDIPLASLVHPPLTTVRLPMREMGSRAMELMMGVIAEKQGRDPAGNEQVLLPYEIVLRAST